MAIEIIEERRARTKAILGVVRDTFLRELDGAEGEEALDAATTVYVTGSAGRGDMGPASDLDPYVVRVDGAVSKTHADKIEGALSGALAKVGLPGLDGDGKYARLVTGSSLFDHLGSPEDDSTGALTKRMLLLLESQPLVRPEAYDRLLELTIDAYWANADRHPDHYLPIVLVNDIVRYWRTVLLNHESRLREKSQKETLSPEEALALRRYSSYKLRVPRCLSCFSALAYLLARTPTEPAHISREDVERMVRLSPLERLEELLDFPATPGDTVSALRDRYVGFLERTEGGKTVLTDSLMSDRRAVEAVSREGTEFTEHMFDLIQTLGGGRKLHRAIVV